MIIFIVVGLIGLVTLFCIRVWQNKAERELTGVISGKFETGLKAGLDKMAMVAKDTWKKAGEKIRESRVSEIKGLEGFRGLVRKTSIGEMIRGRGRLGGNGGNGSKFLNDIKEAKDEIRNGLEKK